MEKFEASLQMKDLEKVHFCQKCCENLKCSFLQLLFGDDYDVSQARRFWWPQLMLFIARFFDM